MSSNLKVNTILPSTGTAIGIGTASGNVDVLGHIVGHNTPNISGINSVTATTFYGSGANLTGITGTTINNNANNRLITGSGTANTLNAESELTYDGASILELQPVAATPARFIGDANRTGQGQHLSQFEGNWNGTLVGRMVVVAGEDTSNKDDGHLDFYTTPSGGSNTRRLRITSDGSVNIGGSSTQTTHLLHLQSTGDAGIHIRADSDNSGENDNPYLSMSQDGSSAQELKIGQNGDAGQNFPESFANCPFIHANHSSAYPLQLAHMDNMVVNIAARKNEIGLNDYNGNTIAGMEIHHRGNDTGAALKLSGHNNTGTPGVKTFTQLTHLGGDAKFMIHHVGQTAIQIGPTRRIDCPAVYGTAISSPMRDLYVESTGQLGYDPSIRASKINIADNNDVSWLYNLTPKTYNKRKRVSQDTNEWTNEAESDLQYGLIAEEVEPVNSNICFYDVDDSNTKKLAGVTYSQLITPLLKAIQEQKAEIDALKTRISTLEGS